MTEYFDDINHIYRSPDESSGGGFSDALPGQEPGLSQTDPDVEGDLQRLREAYLNPTNINVFETTQQALESSSELLQQTSAQLRQLQSKRLLFASPAKVREHAQEIRTASQTIADLTLKIADYHSTIHELEQPIRQIDEAYALHTQLNLAYDRWNELVATPGAAQQDIDAAEMQFINSSELAQAHPLLAKYFSTPTEDVESPTATESSARSIIERIKDLLITAHDQQTGITSAQLAEEIYGDANPANRNRVGAVMTIIERQHSATHTLNRIPVSLPDERPYTIYSLSPVTVQDPAPESQPALTQTTEYEEPQTTPTDAEGKRQYVKTKEVMDHIIERLQSLPPNQSLDLDDLCIITGQSRGSVKAMLKRYAPTLLERYKARIINVSGPQELSSYRLESVMTTQEMALSREQAEREQDTLHIRYFSHRSEHIFNIGDTNVELPYQSSGVFWAIHNAGPEGIRLHELAEQLYKDDLEVEGDLRILSQALQQLHPDLQILLTNTRDQIRGAQFSLPLTIEHVDELRQMRPTVQQSIEAFLRDGSIEDIQQAIIDPHSHKSATYYSDLGNVYKKLNGAIRLLARKHKAGTLTSYEQHLVATIQTRVGNSTDWNERISEELGHYFYGTTTLTQPTPRSSEHQETSHDALSQLGLHQDQLAMVAIILKVQNGKLKDKFWQVQFNTEDITTVSDLMGETPLYTPAQLKQPDGRNQARRASLTAIERALQHPHFEELTTHLHNQDSTRSISNFLNSFAKLKQLSFRYSAPGELPVRMDGFQALNRILTTDGMTNNLEWFTPVDSLTIPTPTPQPERIITQTIRVYPQAPQPAQTTQSPSEVSTESERQQTVTDALKEDSSPMVYQHPTSPVPQSQPNETPRPQSQRTLPRSDEPELVTYDPERTRQENEAKFLRRYPQFNSQMANAMSKLEMHLDNDLTIPQIRSLFPALTHTTINKIRHATITTSGEKFTVEQILYFYLAKFVNKATGFKEEAIARRLISESVSQYRANRNNK